MNARYMFRSGLPALLLASNLVGIAHAETLGRLFFSTAERAALDKPQAGMPAEAASVTEAKPIEPPRPSHINGYVSRSDGKSTVWIDDEPRYRREPGIALHPGAISTAARIIVHRSAPRDADVPDTRNR